jgi:hypothetical protein
MSKVRTLKKYKGGGSNELDDLKYRLSIALSIHESKMIVEKLEVTDMRSFKNNTAELDKKKCNECGKNKIY